MKSIRAMNWVLVVVIALHGLLGSKRLAVAQSLDVDVNRDVLVWVTPEAVLRSGEIRSDSKGNTAILSSSLMSDLQRLGIERIDKAISLLRPDDSAAVTVAAARSGANVYANVYRLRLPPGASLDQSVSDLERIGEVGHAEKIGILVPFSTYPNDSLFTNGNQWGLSNFGQSGGAPGADIDAPEAWAITKGSSGVTVAIIDYGVLGWHPDLHGRVLSNGDATWDSLGTTLGHGFLVAGVVAAKVNNRSGVAGLTWDCPILSKDITGHNANNGTVLPPKLFDAMNKGAKIFNNSYGEMDKTNTYPDSNWLAGSAFAELYRNNRVVVAAMGNYHGWERQWPAAYGMTTLSEQPGTGLGVIAVGATDRLDSKWSGSNSGLHIDVVAPSGEARGYAAH